MCFKKHCLWKLLESLWKCGHFPNFNYIFRSSSQASDLPKDAADGTSYMPGAKWDLALDILKAFDIVWHANILQELKPSGIYDQVFSLFLMLPKTPFWCYSFPVTLMVFVMLSVILLSMLTITLFSLNVGNSLSWLLNLNLTFERPRIRIGKTLISMQG